MGWDAVKWSHLPLSETDATVSQNQETTYEEALTDHPICGSHRSTRTGIGRLFDCE